MKNSVLKLDPRDNVLIALEDLRKGERISFSDYSLELSSDVPAKHKFVSENLAAGGPIIMYGILVGKTRKPIQSGELLTTSNMVHEASPFQERSRRFDWTPPDTSLWAKRNFLGYHRSDGQVGTRNYWLVVPLVFCETRNLLVLKQAFEEELGFAPPKIYRQQVAQLVRRYRQTTLNDSEGGQRKESAQTGGPARVFENIDGIKFLLHEGGCGGTREDSNNLCSLLAGYIHHPNVAGITVFSLGCQHSETAILREQIHARNPHFHKPLFVYEQQQSGSEFKMLTEAIDATFSGLVAANKIERAAAPLSRLCVGLKCGGSDGFSGISANPAVGHVSDLIAALGGRTILSEFPELCGVEQSLIDRASRNEVADRFIHLMRDYAARAKAVRSGFDMNPSP